MYTLSCTNLIYAKDGKKKTCKYMLLLWPKHYCVGSHYFLLLVFLWYIFICHLLQTYYNNNNNNSIFFVLSNKLPSCCNICIRIYIYTMFTVTQCSSRYVYISSVNFIHFLFIFSFGSKEKREKKRLL